MADGKMYNSDLPTTIGRVTSNVPIDDRLVVHKQSDLLDNETWNGYVYYGMTVSVVDDQIPGNNGLYMLIDKSQYNKQAWDSSGENYHQNGWRRIDGSSTTANVYMDNAQFGGNGSQSTPYCVENIDGGEITNTSNQQNN